jgi:glycine/D-amino acid oxidase-like deaminating enzyme
VAWAVPAVRDGTVQATWSGVRAKAAGGRPVLRALAPGLTAAVGFAGRGFLVAAHAAEVWAGSLGGGDVPDALEV